MWRKVDIAIEAGNWPSYLALPERLVAELCKESSYLIHQQDPTRVISRCESVSCASERVIVTPRSPPCRRATSSAHHSVCQAIHIYKAHVYHPFLFLSYQTFRVIVSDHKYRVLSARQECCGVWGVLGRKYIVLSPSSFPPRRTTLCRSTRGSPFQTAPHSSQIRRAGRTASINYTWCSSSWNYDLTFFSESENNVFAIHYPMAYAKVREVRPFIPPYIPLSSLLVPGGHYQPITQYIHLEMIYWRFCLKS